jgi:hypothetical protein
MDINQSYNTKNDKTNLILKAIQTASNTPNLNKIEIIINKSEISTSKNKLVSKCSAWYNKSQVDFWPDEPLQVGRNFYFSFDLIPPFGRSFRRDKKLEISTVGTSPLPSETRGGRLSCN